MKRRYVIYVKKKKKSRVMIVKVIQNLRKRMKVQIEKIQENVSKDLEELKNISSFFCGSYRKRKKLSFKKQTTATTAPPPTNNQHTDVSAHLNSIAAHVSYLYSM